MRASGSLVTSTPELMTLTAFIAARTHSGYFLNEQQLAQLVAIDRLCPVLVRLERTRFTCPAQNAQTLMDYAQNAGDHVRDVSLPRSVIEQAKPAATAYPLGRWSKPQVDSSAGDYGGVEDCLGNITSDADPGL
jgi:hypothetical protein